MYMAVWYQIWRCPFSWSKMFKDSWNVSCSDKSDCVVWSYSRNSQVTHVYPKFSFYICKTQEFKPSDALTWYLSFHTKQECCPLQGTSNQCFCTTGWAFQNGDVSHKHLGTGEMVDWQIYATYIAEVNVKKANQSYCDDADQKTSTSPLFEHRPDWLKSSSRIAVVLARRVKEKHLPSPAFCFLPFKT